MDVADSVGDFDTEAQDPGYRPIPFAADSALIRELGERLVGAGYFALAELVKNAYDADATKCIIRLEADRITVSDNGHGMSAHEFRNHWMTIGTRNKQHEGRSRQLRRPTTGSKGVGRLSAQFLAHRMQLITTSEKDQSVRIHALVDWDTTAEAESLTTAEAHFKTEPAGDAQYPEGSSTGTTVIMEGLKQAWTKEQVKLLGRQIWSLQSPFEGWGARTTGDIDHRDFRIEFETERPGLDTAFEAQMRTIVDNWHATIEGKLRHEGGKTFVDVDLRFADEERLAESWPVDLLIGDGNERWLVNAANWQIRIYDFIGRQPGRVPVGEAREYLETFGGVTLYDSGFKLPYYGADNDWLAIEFAHAHRRSTARLLPSRLQVTDALNDLPTQGRILGVVNINTGEEFSHANKEQRASGDYLKILITRDRLATNDAMAQLTNAVRSTIEFYATRQRLRAERYFEIIRPFERPSSKIERISTLVQEVRARLPADETIQRIEREIREVDKTIAVQEVADKAERSLLGSLASTGMAALALEHENKKEIRLGRRLVRQLAALADSRDDADISNVATAISEWLDRLESTRRIFAPMLSPEDRDVVEALGIRSTIGQIVKATKPLMPQISPTVDIPSGVHFPPATFADWHSLFQNVLVNAANAMLDSDDPQVEFRYGRTGRSAWVQVINNGVPIDVSSSAELFEPFRRRQVISSDRAALGLGGMGLGLTIVRMIASLRGCNVRFVETDGRTTFQISWSAE